MCEKIRLDIVLKERYGFSREVAKDAIEKGYVSYQGKIFKKAGEKVSGDIELTIDDKGFLKYVSRGGLKLEKAINEFGIDIVDKVCIDVGASTGGFTDCMLQFGAKKVYSVDVGHGQLADVIKNNPKVVSMENTNVVDLKRDDFPLCIDFASVDVSFVSLTKILSYVYDILGEEAETVALIKPQFEAGKQNINRKGIVKNPKAHKNVLKTVFTYVTSVGFKIKNISFSPVKGGDGNIEYIIYLSKKADNDTNSNIIAADFNKVIEKVVSEAQSKL